MEDPKFLIINIDLYKHVEKAINQENMMISEEVMSIRSPSRVPKFKKINICIQNNRLSCYGY